MSVLETDALATWRHSHRRKESERLDSNQRTPAPKAGALTRLRYAQMFRRMVDPAGVEPATFRLQGGCSPV